MGSNSANTKGVRGQVVKTATGRDDSGDAGVNDTEARDGKKMGGSKTDLSHSLSGSSAVQKGG